MTLPGPAPTTSPFALALCGVLAALAAAPTCARADGLEAQVSSRLVLGGGAELPTQREVAPLFELGARLDVLIGDDRAARFRLGPGVELRTATFGTFEGALGVSWIIPIGMDFVFGGSVLCGGAARLPGPEGARDGAVLVGTLRIGHQPYDHFDAYELGLHFYVSGRWGFYGNETYEVSAGFEIDLELIFVTPIRMIMLQLSAHDPDEPLEEDGAEREGPPASPPADDGEGPTASPPAAEGEGPPAEGEGPPAADGEGAAASPPEEAP